MTRNHSTTSFRSRGFTLIELMVVIVILGLLMGVVVPNLFGQLDRATRETAIGQMRNIGGAIDFYQLDHQRLPKSLDELTEENVKTSEPYMKRIPRDPWDRAYDYRILDQKRRDYQLATSGRDREPGTDDDIVHPEPESK